MSAEPFENFETHRYMSVTSYKKSGEPAVTPVWFLLHEGKLHLWTNRESWKAKRLRRDSRCTVAPCNASGKELFAEPVPGHAPSLEGAEASAVEAAIAARYGFQFKLIRFVNRLRGIREYAVIEISPA